MFRTRMSYKIALISVLVLMTSLLGYTVVRADNPYEDITNLAEKIGEYHVRVNATVNTHIDSLITYFESKEDLQLLLNEETRNKITPPEDDADCSVTGADMNLSAECLRIKLESELELLTPTLSEDLDALELGTSGGEVSQTSSNMESRQTFVNNQLALIREMQSATMSYYRQILFAYPLHTQYEITIIELEVFLDQLKAMKRQIISLPSEFQDVSKTECL